MSLHFVDRVLVRIQADRVAVDAGRSGERGAIRVREGYASQVLLHRCLLGLRNPRLAIQHQQRSRRAVGDIGQLERNVAASRLGPVKDVANATGPTQINLGCTPEGIGLAGAGILGIVCLKDIVDRPVTLAVRVGQAGLQSTQDLAGVQRDLGVPCTVIAISLPKFRILSGWHCQSSSPT